MAEALQTSISNALDHAGDEARLDKEAKKIFSHLSILAPLMRMCIPEFAKFTDQYIIDNCFVDTPQISAMAVNQDENDLLDGNARVTQMNSEESSEDERTIFYDIRFTAKIPKTGKLVRLIINVEIQRIDRLRYRVVTRGIYYGARMISAQYGTVFTRQEYQNIQKVYSIWICPESNKKQNSITSYRITEKCILGKARENKRDYDKMEIIVITLDEEGSNADNPLIRFLNLLLSSNLPLESRKKALKEEYRIQMDEQLTEEMSAMCNLGEGIAIRNRELGMAQGMAQGEERFRALVDSMLKAGRIDDLQRVVSDPVYREEQYKDFNIGQESD
ncbi:MAG: hypothetical protein IJ708_04740 [Clostridia bacterium]|nr:hypothetical protein [Clostridia bacterium]